MPCGWNTGLAEREEANGCSSPDWSPSPCVPQASAVSCCSCSSALASSSGLLSNPCTVPHALKRSLCCARRCLPAALKLLILQAVAAAIPVPSSWGSPVEYTQPAVAGGSGALCPQRNPGPCTPSSMGRAPAFPPLTRQRLQVNNVPSCFAYCFACLAISAWLTYLFYYIYMLPYSSKELKVLLLPISFS